MFRGVKLKDILNIRVLKQKYHFQGPKNDQLINIDLDFFSHLFQNI